MKTSAGKNKDNQSQLHPVGIGLSKETRYKILLGISHKRQIPFKHQILDQLAKVNVYLQPK
jgi:hypothetical protein